MKSATDRRVFKCLINAAVQVMRNSTKTLTAESTTSLSRIAQLQDSRQTSSSCHFNMQLTYILI